MRALFASCAALLALAAAPTASGRPTLGVLDDADRFAVQTAHERVEFAAYYSGKSGSIWDLASKPRSRAAYRAVITPLG
jgi:hypothetical protein